MSFFRFFYDTCLHLYAMGMLPKIAFSLKKYRPNFLARLGKNFPLVDKQGRKLVWVHAVSFGETKAVAPLIKKLKESDPTLKVLVSSVTNTGHAEAKKILEADWHVLLPFDLPYIVRPIVKRVKPDFVILTETDFWYHFQNAAKHCGAKLIVVNGKLSERSYKRYQKFPLFVKNVLQPIDTFFLQSEVYLDRLKNLSISTSKLTVTGNIKLDGMEIRPTHTSELVLTIGSTHAPEEEIWIKALKNIWKDFPHLKVMLAPRHPERFDTVAKLLQEEKISFGRYSQGESLENFPLLLVDTLGQLRQCYSKSSLAFVGGSFTPKVGGHNILEPCFYGKPVLFGPYMHSQPDFLDLMRSYKAGIQVSEDSLVDEVKKLLSSPEKRACLGDNGLKLVKTSQGALEITLNHLLKILRS